MERWLKLNTAARYAAIGKHRLIELSRWRITNIYDYADHPIDCLKGPYVKTGFVLRLYPKGWGVYTGAIQHVSKRNVFAMLDWLHEQQAKPLKQLFKKQEVLHDPNRSYNVGL